jgi:hypothetical protein
LLINCRAGCPQEAVISKLTARGLWSRFEDRQPGNGDVAPDAWSPVSCPTAHSLDRNFGLSGVHPGGVGYRTVRVRNRNMDIVGHLLHTIALALYILR